MKEVGLVYGLNIGEQLGYYDHDLQLLRTLEQSLFEDLTEFLVRLPKSGMMRNGKIYEQRTWVHRRERIWIVAYAESERVNGIMGDYKKKKSRNVESNSSSKKKMAYAEVSDSSSLGRSTGCNHEREYENNISEIRETEKNKQSRSIGKRRIEQVCTDTREISNPSIPGLQNRSKEASGKTRISEKSKRCDWWSIESDVGRLANGVPRRVDKLKGLGNAIVPQIAQVLFKQIKPYL